MTVFQLRLRPLLLAGLLTSTAVPAAFAFEAEEVGERLTAFMAAQQVELSYDSASMVGDDVTLTSVTVRHQEAEEALPLGDLTLQDVSEEADGAFRIGRFAMDQFEYSAVDLTISMEGLLVTGLVLPEDPLTDPFGVMTRYDRMEVARIDVATDAGPVGSVENMFSTLTVADDGAFLTESVAESFTVDLQRIMEDNDAAARIEEFGYGQISGSLHMDGSWRQSDGRLTLSRYEATVNDAGTLLLTADVAGLTPDFMQALDEMGRAEDQDNAAQGMALLGMAQQLTFHGLTIRFTDDTLTDRLLDHTAQQQGATRADVIRVARAAIPMQLSPILGQEMARSIADAVGTFLEAPANIEISAVPENPMPFAMLMGAAMASPETLVRQIGLAVRANQ